MNCFVFGRLGPSCQAKLVETKRTGQIALERIAQVHAGARLKTIRVHALGADQQQGVSKGVADGVTDSLLPTSMVFYAGMTVAAVALGQAFDVDVAAQLLDPSIDPAPTLGTVALLLSFALVTQRYTDKITALKEIEVLMRSTMLPALRAGPWWGIPLLALGAGVGEETLFRALLQQGLEQQFVAQGGLSQLLSVTVASIVFGLAHAINWAYFAFATLGGAVFGIEYNAAGLPCAAASHFLYDWVGLWAFVSVENGAPWAVKLQKALRGGEAAVMDGTAGGENGNSDDNDV